MAERNAQLLLRATDAFERFDPAPDRSRSSLRIGASRWSRLGNGFLTRLRFLDF